MSTRAVGTAAVGLGATLAVLGAGQAAINVRALRTPRADPPPTASRIAVLVPARDEGHNVAPLLADLRAQRGIPALTVTVLDDASSDGTADTARDAAAGDPGSGWCG